MGDLLRLIVFDLDGTLIDSCRDLAESANELIVELGGAPLPEAAIGSMVGEGAALLVRRALDAAGLGHPPGAVSRFLDIYDTRLLNHTRVYDGVGEVVRDARRHARLAVLTNKPSGPSLRILEALRLRPFFADVVGGDSPHGRKPDPAGLLSLAAAAGARRERTLLVGDSVIDFDTARRAGTSCCVAAYGFGFRTFPPERLGEIDCLARDVPALAAAIDRFVSQA